MSYFISRNLANDNVEMVLLDFEKWLNGGFVS